MTGIYYDEVYKPGSYTFAMKQLAAQSDKTAISVVSSAPFAGGVYNDAYKAYTAALVKHDDTHYITIVVTEPTEIGFFINGYFSVNDKIYDIQLLEGTYTSETIPEYQPYFFNRPAHQVTNGQWVDIPTHHFINNRWQGELTSQSPLKFWADGEMLDWRVEGKTSGNLCERYTPVETAQQYSVSLYMFADIQPSTTYTIAFEIDEGSLQYFNENLFTYSQYYVTGTGNKQMLQLNAKTNIQKTASTWNDTYGWIIAKNYTGNATMSHWKKIQLLEGTYTPSTIPPYEPYGGVGDWDETEQKYKIPVAVNGVTTNLYIDHQLMDGDSLDYTTTETQIPIATGNNVLSVDTAVQPSKVFVKFEG